MIRAACLIAVIAVLTPDDEKIAPPAAPAATLADVAFLAGDWVADWNGHVLEEQFTEPRYGTMVGMFRWVTEGKTSITEHIVLEQRDDGVHMFLRHFNPGAAVWASEQDGPMHYRVSEFGDGRVIFEDPERQFPRRIVYHRHPNQAGSDMIVRLEGRQDDGGPREMQFEYRSTDMTTATEMLNATGQSMGFNGGLTIAYHCKDINASLDWYQKILGFKLMYHLEEMGWAELTSPVGGVNVGFSQVEDPKVGGPTCTWGVNDIEHARAKLEAQGVKFDGPTQEIPGMVKLATFFDIDGNSLMLFESLSEEMPEG